VNIHDAVYLRMQSWMVTNFMRNRPDPFLRFLLRLVPIDRPSLNRPPV
jgi:hypothetical protein